MWALVEWMPIHEQGKEVVIKLVGYHPMNPKFYGVPTIVSTISKYETRTGHLAGLMDGVVATSMRTGAASAVAAKHLAHADSTVLGLIGCGAQAVTQLHGLSRVFDLTKVYYYDIDPETVGSFRERCAALELELQFEPLSIDTIIRDSDIVCTATFDRNWRWTIV